MYLVEAAWLALLISRARANKLLSVHRLAALARYMTSEDKSRTAGLTLVQVSTLTVMVIEGPAPVLFVVNEAVVPLT